MSKQFLLDAAERLGKTFVQFYLGYWVIAAGIVSTELAVTNPDTFDYLFTLDNIKAGLVGVAFSILTSLGSWRVGDKDSASLLE